MLGIMILSMVVFFTMMNGIVGTISPTIPDVMTDIPTLYDYDKDGIRITEISDDELIGYDNSLQIQEIESQISEIRDQMNEAKLNRHNTEYDELYIELQKLIEELDSLDYQGFSQPNQKLELYWIFAYPSLAVLFIFIMFAGATYYWEKSFAIFQKGTSINIIKTSILGMVTILLLPEFWDIYAIEMKKFSLYLIDPFGANPDLVVTRLWCKMSCIVDFESVLDGDNWSRALTDPNAFGQTILTQVFLPVFKIIPTLMITIVFFVIAKVRALFIIIIIISLPIWLVCLNIPTLKKLSNDMLTNMIGATISPIFSALTLSVGMIYVESSPQLALEEWITVLSIAIFASVWPVILSPKLSIIASTATSAVQTTIQSTAMFASNMASGLGRGMSTGQSDDSNDNDDLRKYT